MKKLSWAVGCVAALSLVGCQKDKDAPPAAEVEKPALMETRKEAPAAPAAEAPAIGGPAWAITPETSKVAFKGAKVTGSHLGGFKDFKGEIRAPDQKPENGSVKLTIQTASLFTDTEKLTGHLKSKDFFEVETYPTATFASTSIEAAGGQYKVTGNLTLHGVTKQISFPATIAFEGDTVKAKSEFTLNRKDFGIVYPGMPDDLIKDDVAITLDVTAKKQGEATPVAAEMAGAAATPTAEDTGRIPEPKAPRLPEKAAE